MFNAEKFGQILESTSNEKEVENIWWKVLTKAIQTEIHAPHSTDGVIDTEEISCLLEFKHDFDFTKNTGRTKVLAQCIYYLKKFENAGEKVPSTIFVADKNECFVVATKDIEQYLARNYDWSIAPSGAADKNPELVLELMKDESINPFVYNLDYRFSLDDLLFKMKSITAGKNRLVKINSKNIITAFDIFAKHVVTDKVVLGNPQKLAHLFIECLINAKNVYLHPKKKNCLITQGFGEVKVKSDNFLSTFNHFKQEYSPKESQFITEQKDRLVEENTRRKTGEFFTPPIWVDEAHKEIAQNFGEDWKERFRVWDTSCGTANLTRDYHFSELYLSTLNEEDIDIIKTMGYNRGATIWQHDFLNEGDDKLPKELLDGSKELLILMNPPYGSQGSAASYKTEGKRTDGSKSDIALKMNKEKMNHAAKQLYCQFIYRLNKLKIEYGLKMNICMFSPEGFMTKPTFQNFRTLFYDNFNYKSGFIFKASEFSDIEMNWPIAFTCWEAK